MNSDDKTRGLKISLSPLLQKWEGICLGIGACAYLLYVLYIYVEVPFESYISKFYLIELLYSRKLTFKSLLTVYGANGMLASNLFFLLNIKLFDFSVLAENLMNAVLVVIVGYVALKKYAVIIGNKQKKWYYYVAIAIMTVFLFTCMQQGGGGMSLQVRFGLTSFVVVSWMVDRVLTDKSEDNRYYLLTIIALFLSINVFGSGYSFAGIPFVFLLVCILSLYNKKIDIKNVGICVAYLCATILYFFQYGFLSGGTKNGETSNLLAILYDMPTVLKEFIFWCGSCVLGRASLEDGHISANIYLIVGIIVLILIVVSIFLYFKTKMYKKTYLPIFWVGYFVTLFCLLYVGRAEKLGLGFTTNSWYTVHTKILSISVIGIYVYAFNEIEWKKKVYSIIMWVSSGCVCLFVLFGTACTIIRLPYEKAWLKDKQAYFFVESIDELPVDESGITPLFHDRETSWEAIELLKKYHLSIFKDYDAYELMRQKRAENQ